MFSPFSTSLLPMLMGALLLTACKPSAPAGPMQMPPSEVAVITVQAGKVGIQRELPGRIEASRVAEVRARVTGVVEKRLFTEGSEVKAGQSLYQIDAAPYQAAYQVAMADVAKAEADHEEADYQAKRYQQLFESKSVSELEKIKAVSRLKQSEAQLLSARAAVTTAKLNLDYSKVLAPISGRVGRELVTEGALVSQQQATPMAVIQQVDPVYVNFTQESVDVLGLFRAKSNGKIVAADEKSLGVTLLLPDGTHDENVGKLIFSDVAVDASTGQVNLRASVPNKSGLLMPGMFVRVLIEQANYPSAFLLPQQSVIRSDKGDVVMLVGEDNVLNPRPVKVAGTYQGKWIVIEGLKNGEKVLVEGIQKARPGSVVKAVEWVSPDARKVDGAK